MDATVYREIDKPCTGGRGGGGGGGIAHICTCTMIFIWSGGEYCAASPDELPATHVVGADVDGPFARIYTVIDNDSDPQNCRPHNLHNSRDSYLPLRNARSGAIIFVEKKRINSIMSSLYSNILISNKFCKRECIFENFPRISRYYDYSDDFCHHTFIHVCNVSTF